MKIFSPLRGFGPRVLGGGPLLPLEGGILDPPSSRASLDEAVAPLFSPSPSSEGVTSSILTSTGSGAVSGRAAGHRISFAYAIHCCLEGNW